MSDASSPVTFWDHLDELRSRLIRVVVTVIVVACIAFVFKDQLFDIVLAPNRSQFFSYRLLNLPPFGIHLVNTQLTEQFMVHMKISVYAGLLMVSPYILYELFRFISPGLYSKERRYVVSFVGGAYVMFILGVLVDYFLIFPMTLRFLGTYQVNAEVTSMLTLQSYVDTLISMSFLMGVLFQLPALCWLLGRFGIINGDMMSRYRRHAVVVIFVIAAIVTPTTDVFTLLAVAMPILLLYEISIWVVKA
jgi:Tat protein translocase TatC